MEKKTNNNLQKTGNDLVTSLENVFKNAPHLPANVREILVQIAPWLALIFGILGVFAGIAAIGVSPLAVLGGVNNSAMLFVTGIVAIISSVLNVMAFPKLQKRQFGGWMLLFWSELLAVISLLTSAFTGRFDIGSVLGIIIGFYLLFEMKSYYK